MDQLMRVLISGAVGIRNSTPVEEMSSVSAAITPDSVATMTLKCSGKRTAFRMGSAVRSPARRLDGSANTLLSFHGDVVTLVTLKKCNPYSTTSCEQSQDVLRDDETGGAADPELVAVVIHAHHLAPSQADQRIQWTQFSVVRPRVQDADLRLGQAEGRLHV